MATWSGAGGLLASLGAVATWLCCIPIVAGAAGGLAAAASVAWIARPWLLGAAGIFLAMGFWYAYRREPCADGTCAPASRRRARVLLWIATAIALLALTYPQWSAWAYAAML